MNFLIKFILKHFSNDTIYNFATQLLYKLYVKDYCIWQSYTKDDIKVMDGHYPSKNKWRKLQDNLMNYDLINCN